MSCEILEISTVSTYDYIRLVAHYNLICGGNKNSEDSLVERGYSEAQLKVLRSQSTYQPIESQGIRFLCPLNKFKYPLMSYVLSLFENYERGALPFPGAVTEQPNQIMDIFALLQSLRHEATPQPKKQVKPDGRQHKGKHRNK